MTQEDKELLLKDLCARLPYEVIVKVIDHNDASYIKKGVLYKIANIDSDCNGISYLFSVDGVCCAVDITEIKPYLRPMSSMTEEEMGEYAKFKLSYDDVYEFTDFRTTGKGFINAHTTCKNYTFQVNNRTMLHDGVIGIDWLNEHHFDYRGLIKKGLALPPLEGMYNFK